MKDDYKIRQINKQQCASILMQHHYLKDISRGFKTGFNYGLFLNDVLHGCVIFTGLPVPELVKGMLGLERNQQQGLYELSRLCLTPEIQAQEHNITSWFLSRALKQFRRDCDVKLILSYADASFHAGIIYRACNFDYYGLTDAKKDFWIKQDDGNYIKHNRGKVRNLIGEWRERSRKHRYVLCFDKSLHIKWAKQTWKA